MPESFPALSEGDIAKLFDHLPMVVFYAKDKNGVFTRCNRRFEELHGLGPSGAIGLTDFDLHHLEIASRYRSEDEQIMETGIPVRNRTWMVPGAKGVLRWWVSSKNPIHDSDGSVCGIAGVMYELSGAAGITGPFSRIEPALKLIHADEEPSLKTEELAAACNYSESQFNRVFRQLMGQSARRYVLRHRLETAKDLLSRTDLPLSEVAFRAGFYDASDFGKRFRDQEGITPRQYRMKLQSLIQTDR
jgi:PAS domain S-box-containing protein